MGVFFYIKIIKMEISIWITECESDEDKYAYLDYEQNK